MYVKREIFQYLRNLADRYNTLQEEREFLLNGVQARLAEVNAERQEIVVEAQLQLDRLNALRVADGENPYTLQQIQDWDRRSGPRDGV